MFFKLLLAFTLIPVVELYLLIKIGTVIGAGATVFLILLSGIAGAALARSQGLKVLSEIHDTASRGQIPGDQLLQGLLVLIGGFTLLTPGFITDLLGLSMIFPPSRRFYTRTVRNYIFKQIQSGRWQVRRF